MSKPIIIGITGKARAGKDTTADYLVNHYGFVKISFAAPIKRALSAMTGIADEFIYGDRKEEKLDVLCGNSPRRLLQTLGTEWGRDIVGADFWIKLAMAEAERQMAAGNNVVISDVRFDNEATAIDPMGGYLWEVSRPKSQSVEAHSSEVGVTAPRHMLYNNFDLNSLYCKVDELMRIYRIEKECSCGAPVAEENGACLGPVTPVEDWPITRRQVAFSGRRDGMSHHSQVLELAKLPPYARSMPSTSPHQRGCRYPTLPDEAVVKAIDEAGEPNLSEKSIVCGCAKAAPVDMTWWYKSDIKGIDLDRIAAEHEDLINEIIETCTAMQNQQLLEEVATYWPDDMGLSRPCYKDNEPATPRLVFERGETIRLKNESLDAAGTLILLRSIHSLKSSVEESARKGFSTAPLRALRYTRAVEVLSSIGESMVTARKICELFLYVVTGKFPDYGTSAN